MRICACSASARCVLCAHASVLYADTWPFLRCAFRTLRLFYAPSPVPRCADRVLTEWVLSRSVLCTRTEAHIRTGKGKGSTEDDVLAIQEGAAEDGDEEARSCVCRAVRKKRRRALLYRHRTEASVQASCAPPLPLTPRNYAPQGPRLRHPLLTLYGRAGGPAVTLVASSGCAATVDKYRQRARAGKTRPGSLGAGVTLALALALAPFLCLGWRG